MNPNFADRLASEVLAKRSQVCVGLDPSLDRMPAALIERYSNASAQGCGCGRHEIAGCFEEFCAAIIDAVAPHAVAIKPQLACFEQYGPPGLKAFKHLCNHASRAGLLVVADAKRGDIGVSAAAYSAAYIGRPQGFVAPIANLGADAITVNPLFGSDGMQPFLDDCSRYGAGIFVLVKTSNPGSAELQDLLVSDEVPAGGAVARAESRAGGAVAPGQTPRKFHEKVASLVDEWGTGLVGDSGYSSVGAVIGATHPEELAGLRKMLPKSLFLIPGYGAQGGGAGDVAAAFDSRGLGALVTASRSIIYAGQGEDFATGAAEAAERMRSELWQQSRKS